MGSPTIYFLLLIFAVFAYAQFDFSLCERVRVRMDGPAACGKLNDTYLVFANSGSMFLQTCTDKQVWNSVPMAKCFTSRCPRLCESDTNSVCARSGSTYKSFKSTCDFMYFSCRNFRRVWTPVNSETCKKLKV